MEVYRGDTLEIECEVRDSNGELMDLTESQIRVELTDLSGVSIKKATANVSGGSDDEVKVTGLGKFIIFFTAEEMGQLEAKDYWLEVEITQGDKVFTVIQEKVRVKEDIIAWNSK